VTASPADTRPDAAPTGAGSTRHRLPLRLLPAGLALALVSLLGGLLLGQRMDDGGVARVADPVSVGFLRDMQVHHSQAVQMSTPMHRRSDDRQLSYLAYDILTTQHGQIGIMTGWLDLSRQTQTVSGPAMAWMGSAHDGGPMPGMATRQQVDALSTLPLPRATEQFLRLMIDHHRGALPMAQYAARHAGHPDVARLAESMYAGQEAEIALMQSMLAERGLAPQPEPAGGGHGGHG
jgi:uncharacterized protein (DUF305 family)